MGRLFLVQPSQRSLGAGLVVSNKNSIWASSFIALCVVVANMARIGVLQMQMWRVETSAAETSIFQCMNLCVEMHGAELPRWMCKTMC